MLRVQRLEPLARDMVPNEQGDYAPLQIPQVGARSTPRVMLRVQRFQALARDMGVDLRRRDVGVAK